VAIGVNEDGHREIVGAAAGMKEDKHSWLNFLTWLNNRGLDGVRMIIGGKCLGVLGAADEVFPQASISVVRCIFTGMFSPSLHGNE
jgi:transposase-like protein